MIFLDNSATTQIRKEVAEFVAKYSVENFFNPSSIYIPAIKVKADLDSARERLKVLLGGSRSDRIIFTGSATEANNLVLNGLARKNERILVSMGEHPSIYEVAKNLSNLGYRVDYVGLSTDGKLDIEEFREKMGQDVGLVSCIHVNNETGAINDIAKIAQIAKSIAPNCKVHSDGVQAFGKIRLDLANTEVDAYTMSSHKIHGPKGVASLYIKNGINIKPHILGGGQESGIRSGTENPAGILGFVMAGEIMYSNFDNNRQHIDNLWHYFVNGLSNSGIGYHINSPMDCLSNVLSVSFYGVRGEVLLHCLEKYDIYVSTGSACSSKSVGNRILQSMRQDNETMLGNVRFSFSEFNTTAQLDFVLDALKKEIPLIKH